MYAKLNVFSVWKHSHIGESEMQHNNRLFTSYTDCYIIPLKVNWKLPLVEWFTWTSWCNQNLVCCGLAVRNHTESHQSHQHPGCLPEHKNGREQSKMILNKAKWMGGTQACSEDFLWGGEGGAHGQRRYILVGGSGGMLPQVNFRDFGLPWTTLHLFSWWRKRERECTVVV